MNFTYGWSRYQQNSNWDLIWPGLRMLLRAAVVGILWVLMWVAALAIGAMFWSAWLSN